MKETTNFPYDVIKANTKLQLQDLSRGDDQYVYLLKVPDFISADQNVITNKDSLVLAAEINCSSTMYREVVVSESLDEIQVEIDKKLVFDSFSIDVLMLLSKNADWHRQSLNKGMPIAHLGSFRMDLETRSQGLISFCKHDSNTATNIEYSYRDQSVHIIFPEERFQWLTQNRHSPLLKSILSSQFGQIALIGACQRMKDTGNDHLLWYKELKNRWKVYNKDDSDFPEGDEIIPFVSSLLKNPSDTLINYLIQNGN